MIICALVDYIGTSLHSPEEEYEDIKRYICEFLDLNPEEVIFKKNIYPFMLKNQPCDIYVIDYGGILPGSEDTIDSHFRDLIEQIEDKPNILFIIWTAFTVKRFYKEALEKEYSRDYMFPNVILCGGFNDGWEKKLIEWFKNKE